LLVLGTNGTVHSVPQSEQVTVVDSSLLSFREPLSSREYLSLLEFLKERDGPPSLLEVLREFFLSEYFDL
jgi:hypothetical protein